MNALVDYLACVVIYQSVFRFSFILMVVKDHPHLVCVEPLSEAANILNADLG